MAVRLLAHEVSDLCLGKPPLRSLSVNATAADALSALKISGDTYVSVWNCDHSSSADADAEDGGGQCRCVGKVCMVDVICFLCRAENLASPSAALESPVSALLPKFPNLVVHVEPDSSLLDAIDFILQGAQNLVVPIRKTNSRRRQLRKSNLTGSTLHVDREFCWLTTEDIVRSVLSSIGLFSPFPSLSIEALGVIGADFLAVDYHSPASSSVDLIAHSLADQTSVAVVDGAGGALIGEISPFALACCDETVACAVATLSTGDLMAYIDCGGPPEDIVRAVKRGLRDQNLGELLEKFTSASSTAPAFSSSSSDEEGSSPSPSPPSPVPRSVGRYGRSWSYSARMMRRAEAIVCQPGSSLVAVMVQAIAHRVNYVWVMEDDGTLVGIVTFPNILRVFRGMG